MIVCLFEFVYLGLFGFVLVCVFVYCVLCVLSSLIHSRCLNFFVCLFLICNTPLDIFKSVKASITLIACGYGRKGRGGCGWPVWYFLHTRATTVCL